MSSNALFSFAAFIVGSILIAIILYRHRQTSARFLAFLLFTLTSSNFFFFLFESRNMLYLPGLFRVGPLINYLAAPSVFFYVLYVLNEKRKFRWQDVLHLIPAALFFIDFFPLYISSSNHKKQIIEALYQNSHHVLLFKEGWLMPQGTHSLVRPIIAFIYVVYLTLYLTKTHEAKKFQKSQPVMSWIIFILILFFLFSSLCIVAIISHSSFAWALTVKEPLIIFSLLALVLLFKPHILYGPYTLSHNLATAKSKPPVLHDGILLRLQQGILHFIKQQHYLRKNIKLKEVADELGIQPYILSAYVNQVHSLRFNDFINCYRIQYVSDGLRNGQWNLLTLEAIAKEAGFNNRTTFLTAFKKFKGMTPSTFMQVYRKAERAEIHT